LIQVTARSVLRLLQEISRTCEPPYMVAVDKLKDGYRGYVVHPSVRIDTDLPYMLVERRLSFEEQIEALVAGFYDWYRAKCAECEHYEGRVSSDERNHRQQDAETDESDYQGG
jgi:hypothetical protein